MSTPSGHLPASSIQVHLKKSQTLVLSQSSNHYWMRIKIDRGVVRLFTHQHAYARENEITLAIMTSDDCGSFKRLQSCDLAVEGISEATVNIVYENHISQEESDFLRDWLLDLHLIRNPARAEDRLFLLLKLLTERFGRRTIEGYTLDFLLSHSRIAEIIGTTRSTVSRTLGVMKKSNQLVIDELRESLVLRPFDKVDG